MSACKFCGTDLSKMSRPAAQWDHVQACELDQLRALRDRLIAVRRGPNQAVWFDDILALIARAQELAD